MQLIMFKKVGIKSLRAMNAYSCSFSVAKLFYQPHSGATKWSCLAAPGVQDRPWVPLSQNLRNLKKYKDSSMEGASGTPVCMSCSSSHCIHTARLRGLSSKWPFWFTLDLNAGWLIGPQDGCCESTAHDLQSDRM